MSRISDSARNDKLKETVAAILSNFDVQVAGKDIETCHWIGQADKLKSKKTKNLFLK